MSANKLGRRLAEYRKRHDLSQRELAQIVGLERSWVCRVEAGRVVSVPTLQRIAKKLRIPAEELL